MKLDVVRGTNDFSVESRYPGLRRFLVELLSNIVRRNFNLICPEYYKEKSLVPLTTSSFIVKCNFFLIKNKQDEL
jgi:hypothetical protein